MSLVILNLIKDKLTMELSIQQLMERLAKTGKHLILHMQSITKTITTAEIHGRMQFLNLGVILLMDMCLQYAAFLLVVSVIINPM